MDVAAAFSDMLSDVAALPYSGNVAAMSVIMVSLLVVASAPGTATRWLLGALSLGVLGVFTYGYVVPRLPQPAEAIVVWGSLAAAVLAVLALVGSGALFLLVIWAEGRCTRILEEHGVRVRLSHSAGAFPFLWSSRRLSAGQWEVFARLVDDADPEVLRLAAPRDLLRYVRMASVL